jgi:hypothetical protein
MPHTCACRQAGRELQRWAPDAAEESGGLGGLEDTLGGHVEPGWDQFALNEAKFGVKTDYNEVLYTTELDLRCAGWVAHVLSWPFFCSTAVLSWLATQRGRIALVVVVVVVPGTCCRLHSVLGCRVAMSWLQGCHLITP